MWSEKHRGVSDLAILNGHGARSPLHLPSVAFSETVYIWALCTHPDGGHTYLLLPMGLGTAGNDHTHNRLQ